MRRDRPASDSVYGSRAYIWSDCVSKSDPQCESEVTLRLSLNGLNVFVPVVRCDPRSISQSNIR